MYAYLSCFSRDTLYAVATISEVHPMGYHASVTQHWRSDNLRT